MIEADTHANPTLRGQPRQIEELIGVPCRRLLHEHMDTGLDGGARNRGLRILRVATMMASTSGRARTSRQSVPDAQPGLAAAR